MPPLPLSFTVSSLSLAHLPTSFTGSSLLHCLLSPLSFTGSSPHLLHWLLSLFFTVSSLLSPSLAPLPISFTGSSLSSSLSPLSSLLHWLLSLSPWLAPLSLSLSSLLHWLSHFPFTIGLSMALWPVWHRYAQPFICGRLIGISVSLSAFTQMLAWEVAIGCRLINQLDTSYQLLLWYDCRCQMCFSRSTEFTEIGVINKSVQRAAVLWAITPCYWVRSEDNWQTWEWEPHC